MSKPNAISEEIMKHLLENAAITLVGDASGVLASATAGSVYISLHTADPGDSGTQLTSAATYTGYARKAIARADAQWTTVSANPATAKNTNVVTFAACTGGSSTVTHFGVGTDLTGAGKLLYSGALDSSLAVSDGITPEFAALALTVTET